MTISRRSLLKAGLAGLAASTVAGCNNGAASRGDGEVIYWLWDSAQLPMYTECAKLFHEQNPQYSVKIAGIMRPARKKANTFSRCLHCSRAKAYAAMAEKNTCPAVTNVDTTTELPR